MDRSGALQAESSSRLLRTHSFSGEAHQQQCQALVAGRAQFLKSQYRQYEIDVVLEGVCGQ